MKRVTASHSLRGFLALLAEEGELRRLAAAVNPELELAAITDRVCKSPLENRALLFEAVTGSRFRVATNLFGSAHRLALALGRGDLSELTGWLDTILAGLPGATAHERLASLAASRLWRNAAPQLMTAAPPLHLQDGVVDLGLLPVLKCHPLDGYPDHGGRFMTLPLVITAAPGQSGVNCGMYRCGVAGPDLLAIKWSSSSGAAAHAAVWAERGEPMPVTIALGGPPVLTFAATLPLPELLDEFSFAGLLAGEALRIYRCHNGLPAPVEAELVIEGYLQPGAVTGSGAFGNHSGYYTPAADAAAIRITSIRHRDDMIYPATVVGRPPMEDCWFARGGERLILPLLRIDIPEVIELHYPLAGIFHGAAIVSVRDAAGRGGDILTRIRRTPWFTESRLLILVDGDQDPADAAGVYWRVLNNTDWGRDLGRDAATLTIDATRKTTERRLAVAPDREVAALVASRWREYGFNE